MKGVTESILKRKSCRKFLRDKKVPLSLIREILDIARFAPSGGNTQPWHLYVVGGEKRDELSRAVRDQLESGNFGEKPEFNVYPPKDVIPKEYMRRRRELGFEMYKLMGIERKDRVGRIKAMAENWDFFGAPVGIIVTTDRVVDRNGWGHVGCLLQSICLLAEERGLSTCLQEAWGSFSGLTSRVLGIPDSEILWCGIAIGYEDTSAPVNTLRSKRDNIDSFTKFIGFGNEGFNSKL